jgi:hypothetical protein
MNKDHCNLAVKLAGAFLLTGVATAEQDQQMYYIDSADSVSLSLRFGLNLSGKFTGTGGSLASPIPGKYDNGYVLPDNNGNVGGYDWYWGYQSAGQVSGSPNNYQINFTQSAATGIAPEQADPVYDPRIGAELTYNHQFGVKEDWHHLRYGLEVAANYTPVSFHNTYVNDNVTVSQTQYTYAFSSLVTQLPAPGYSGPFNGNNSDAVINVPYVSATPLSSAAGYQFIAQQDFQGDLWGLRVGPYVEMPLNRKLSLHLSGGFAVGLLDDSASWTETLTPPAGGGAPTIASGGGEDLAALWGGYVRLNASWQLDRHWGVEIGAQFQDLGNYSHDFGGRTVQLDLSQSIFVEAGISYSF